MHQRELQNFGSDDIILSANIMQAFGVDVRLRRLAERGQLHRVARGVYFNAVDWRELSDDQRYAIRVRAAALRRSASVPVSHQSAAVLWGLPMLGAWPDEVHFLTERASGGRSDPGIRKHALGIDARDVTMLDGILVTTIERTVVDLAATLDLKSAVAAVDRSLLIDRFARTRPLTTKPRLLETVERMLPFRGSVRARAIIEFSTDASGSLAESGSRVNIALSGFPEPELQHPFVIEGRTVESDFYWRDFDALGECDGKGKYFDPVMLAGRTTAEVVYAEKLREDALRREVRAFTRWDFPTGMSQSRLRTRLMQLGLPTGPPRLISG